MASFSIRVKTKSGQVVVGHLTLSSTILELQQYISCSTNIPVSRLCLLTGYPPKPIVIANQRMTLDELDIKSGDTLIAQEKENASIASLPHTVNDLAETGPLMRKIVPADNSCLFTSLGFVLGGKVDAGCGSYMRQIIAEEVSKDDENFSEAILGKPNKDYCNWILKPETWGGGIELAVLSDFYGIEIAVVDTLNAVINRFGEDKNHEYRVFLIFDGIHYDPLYKETLEPDGTIQTLFLSSNEKVLSEAEELAHEAKSSKQYTDVNNFTLKCIVCKELLTGQQQAQSHAQKTGHMNFGEVSS